VTTSPGRRQKRMGPRFRGNVTNVAADAAATGFATLSEADEEVISGKAIINTRPAASGANAA